MTTLVVCLSVAALFAVAWFYTRNVVVLLAVVLWAAFPPYNYWILSNCSGDCNIRIDLLLVLPLLLGVSLIALFLIALIGWRKAKETRADRATSG